MMKGNTPLHQTRILLLTVCTLQWASE